MTVLSLTRAASPSPLSPSDPIAPPGGGSIDMSRDFAEPASARPPTGSHTDDAAGTSSVAARAEVVTPRGATAGAAHAFATGRAAGFDAWLEAHPAQTRELLSMPEGRLRAELLAALGSEYRGHLAQVEALNDASNLVDRLDEAATPMLREAVRREAASGIERQISRLEDVSPGELATHLRHAPSGSAAARLANEIHLDGGDMDAEHVEAWQHRTLDGLREMRDRLQGQTWSADEFPGSTARVRERYGLTQTAPGSIAEDALTRTPNEARDVYESISHAVHGLEFLEAFAGPLVEADAIAAASGEALAVEGVISLLSEGLIAAAPMVVVAVATHQVGEALDHINEEGREHRRELARGLGL